MPRLCSARARLKKLTLLGSTDPALVIAFFLTQNVHKRNLYEWQIQVPNLFLMRRPVPLKDSNGLLTHSPAQDKNFSGKPSIKVTTRRGSHSRRYVIRNPSITTILIKIEIELKDYKLNVSSKASLVSKILRLRNKILSVYTNLKALDNIFRFVSEENDIKCHLSCVPEKRCCP